MGVGVGGGVKNEFWGLENGAEMCSYGLQNAHENVHLYSYRQQSSILLCFKSKRHGKIGLKNSILPPAKVFKGDAYSVASSGSAALLGRCS